MKESFDPPGSDEFELTLFGPGYGESIVLHVGGNTWVVVDSCIDEHRTPRALNYLKDIGIDPEVAVKLIVATHWHDDHIRGMAKLLASCRRALFCCSAAMCRHEFFTVMNVLGGPDSATNYGLKELYGVYTLLQQKESKPSHAIANRRIFKCGTCEIWSLSPSDSTLQRFQQTVGKLIPTVGKPRTCIPDLSPNEAAVALWISVGDIAVLLGSDLEKRGWMEIVNDPERPAGKASAFKIPHHGSKTADAPAVWQKMLDNDPFSVLTPWHRGRGSLPSRKDVERILSKTEHVYASTRATAAPRVAKHRSNEVTDIVLESNIELLGIAKSSSAIRLRRPLEPTIDEGGRFTAWQVDLFGTACHLHDFFVDRSA